MVIYRIENNKGFGPYHVSECYRDVWADNWHEGDSTHLLPEEETWRDNNGNLIPPTNKWFITYKYWKFGFETQTQLHNWFSPNELMKLEKLGFKKVEIEIEDTFVLRGTRQVVFLPLTK
jgi:hypothetical protein